MPRRQDPYRVRTDSEYRAARMDLDDALRASQAQGEARIDELLEAIESCETEMRFVPDWSGESYRNAA
jgi:hypothetical protein